MSANILAFPPPVKPFLHTLGLDIFVRSGRTFFGKSIVGRVLRRKTFCGRDLFWADLPERRTGRHHLKEGAIVLPKGSGFARIRRQRNARVHNLKSYRLCPCGSRHKRGRSGSRALVRWREGKSGEDFPGGGGEGERGGVGAPSKDIGERWGSGRRGDVKDGKDLAKVREGLAMLAETEGAHGKGKG